MSTDVKPNLAVRTLSNAYDSKREYPQAKVEIKSWVAADLLDYVQELEAKVASAKVDALREAAAAVHEKGTGVDGIESRTYDGYRGEPRGFLQRHNVTSVGKWLQFRAEKIERGELDTP